MSSRIAGTPSTEDTVLLLVTQRVKYEVALDQRLRGRKDVECDDDDDDDVRRMFCE